MSTSVLKWWCHGVLQAWKRLLEAGSQQTHEVGVVVVETVAACSPNQSRRILMSFIHQMEHGFDDGTAAGRLFSSL